MPLGEARGKNRKRGGGEEMSCHKSVEKQNCFIITLWTKGPKGPLGLILPGPQGLLPGGCG